MRHLVLGSEGQIGKYVVEEIERNGDEALRWDIVLDPVMDLRAGLVPGCHPSAHQDTRTGPLPTLFKEADFVHFLAFDVGGSAYLQQKQNSLEYINNNMAIMMYTFQLLHLYEKPFYFASSQMANMTDSVYGQLKAVGESYTKALGGLNLRFWNIYGYESDPEKTHVITDFIKMALTDKKICCRTDGSEARNFTHAEDAARLIYLITQKFDRVLDNPDSLMTGWGPYYKTDPRVLPLVSNPHRWTSIRKIAQIIGGELHVPVYYSENQDHTQTIKNEVPDNDWDYLMNRLEVGRLADRIEIEAGIKDMIDRIKADA
jgi:nucleoside-diphosphate-sugar epimerase